MQPLKGLTLDVGGTLDGPGVAWRPRFERLYRGAGVIEQDARSEDAFRRAFFDADDHLPDRHPLAGLGLSETVRHQVADTLENLGRPDARLADEIASAFIAECRDSFARARPILEGLASRLRLGIVSNFYGNLADVLRGEGLLELFRGDAVIDSRAVGFEKPDARIFHSACRGLGLAPAEVAHAGDSWPRDVMGAVGAGLVAIWLAPEDARAGADSGSGRFWPPGILGIERLSDLEAVLAGERAS
jgi:putative hydrolase of the HAD superfamily